MFFFVRVFPFYCGHFVLHVSYTRGSYVPGTRLFLYLFLLMKSQKHTHPAPMNGRGAGGGRAGGGGKHAVVAHRFDEESAVSASHQLPHPRIIDRFPVPCIDIEKVTQVSPTHEAVFEFSQVSRLVRSRARPFDVLRHLPTYFSL